MGGWSSFGEWLQLGNHQWQERFFDCPDNGIVDAEIIMDNPVSEPTYAVPINFWKAVFKLLWQADGSFTNDFKIADHSIHRFAVFCKVVETLSCCVVKDFMSTLQNVTDQKLGSRLDIDDLRFYCLEVFVLHTPAGDQVHLFVKALFNVMG